MKKKELVMVIYDDTIYLKEKKYKLKYLKKSKITDFEKGKKEIEKIVKENKLNKSIINNKLIIAIANNLDDCDIFVIKNIFEDLQFNKITFIKIKDLISNNINLNNKLIIFYNKDYYEMYYNNQNYLIDTMFLSIIYEFIKDNNVKSAIIFSNNQDIETLINTIKTKLKIEVLYNKNLIMQLFLKIA